MCVTMASLTKLTSNYGAVWLILLIVSKQLLEINTMHSVTMQLLLSSIATGRYCVKCQSLKFVIVLGINRLGSLLY